MEESKKTSKWDNVKVGKMITIKRPPHLPDPEFEKWYKHMTETGQPLPEASPEQIRFLASLLGRGCKKKL